MKTSEDSAMAESLMQASLPTEAKGTEARGCEQLSIIVPVYNNPQDLRECLSALMGAVVPGAELVAVDDASTAASVISMRGLTCRCGDPFRATRAPCGEVDNRA
jgi:Glycosyl transferase family 2